jgi:hypothetical protein
VLGVGWANARAIADGEDVSVVMLDAILALGILLSNGTQLRFGDMPIGPGELLLVTWLLLAFIGQLLHAPPRASLALTIVARFWIAMAFAQAAGLVVGLALEPFFDVPSIVHDVVAYSLLACVGLMMAIRLADQAARRRTAWLVAIFGAGCQLLLLADAFDVVPIAAIEPWFFDRLKGWCNDANQLGLLSACLTANAVFLAQTRSGLVGTLVGAACAVIAVVTGILTKSDSYTVFLLVAVPVMTLTGARRWTETTRPPPPVKALIVGLALVATPLFVAALVPFVPAVLDRVENYSKDVYDDNDQGATRFMLWSEAVKKGTEAGMAGMGPGAHLTSKSYKRPPPDKFEAHNTTLDLFTQGGLLASAAFLGLIGSAAWCAIRARIAALAGLSCGLLVFSLFHFVIRHPEFWFSVILTLQEAALVLSSRGQVPSTPMNLPPLATLRPRILRPKEIAS